MYLEKRGIALLLALALVIFGWGFLVFYSDGGITGAAIGIGNITSDEETIPQIISREEINLENNTTSEEIETVENFTWEILAAATSLTAPADPVAINVGQSFSLECKVKCGDANCLNMFIAAQWDQGASDWVNMDNVDTKGLYTSNTNPVDGGDKVRNDYHYGTWTVYGGAVSTPTYQIRCNGGYDGSSDLSGEETVDVNPAADTTKPEVTIVSPSTQNYTTSTVVFNVSMNEDGGGCNLSFDNFATNTSMAAEDAENYSYTNSSMEDGDWTAYFGCEDSSGNQNKTE